MFAYVCLEMKREYKGHVTMELLQRVVTGISLTKFFFEASADLRDSLTRSLSP